MAKKPIEDDILTGGSIGSGKEKSSKKENKKSAGGIKIAKKTATIIKSAVCIVIVIALLVTYVATGAVRKGFIASLSLPAQTLTGVTVSNGDQKAKIKVSTYNFYYASTYNTLKSQQEQYQQYNFDMSQMGLDVDFTEKLSKQTYTDKETNEEMTWAEHLDDMVLDAIESTYTYYLAAVAANGGEEPDITQDQKDQLEETIKSYEETANKYGYTLSGYFVRAMGKGVTEKVFRTESIRQYIASNYKTELTNDIESKEYTADDVNKYKDEHTADLQTVDIKLFEADSEDNAKAFKDELKADGSNFAELAAKYSTTDFNKMAYKEDGFTTQYGVTKSILQNQGAAIAAADPHNHEEGEEHSDDEEQTYSGLDWLFSADRKAGDIYQHSTSVVYVITPAAITNAETVNVRHILIAPETDDDKSATDATEEQWNAAYSKAEEILNNWKSGDATEDSFAALAKENTTDTGSKDNGGLYEGVVPGQMVNPFSAWSFDNSRKAGDTGIVRSTYGYHIMYFVGTTGEKIWEYNAKKALASADGESQSKKLEDEYTLKVNWFGSRYFEKDVDIDN